MQTVLPESSRLYHVWRSACTERLIALYQDPIGYTVEEITQRLNREFSPARSVRACLAKIQALGICDRNTGDKLWPLDRIERLTSLYESTDAPSYQVIANLINLEFGTSFSRNAICGKVNRLKLSGRNLPANRETIDKGPRPPRAPRRSRARQRYDAGSKRLLTIFDAVDMPELRVVHMEPRAPGLTVTDLERNDCRWPVSSDDALHFFCGHPQHVRIGADGMAKTASYCRHHHLVSIGRGTSSERAAVRMGAAA
jgi:hypothetical protein